MVNGKHEVFTNPPDASGTSFSGWGNSGFATWVYSVDPSIRMKQFVCLILKADAALKMFTRLYTRDIAGAILMILITSPLQKQNECFVASDGVTIIPIVYDLARATCLSEAFPNKPAYVTDEYDKRTVKLNVVHKVM